MTNSQCGAIRVNGKPNNLTVTAGVGLDIATQEFEQWFIWWALERNGFNQSRTAEELKIHRNSLVNRLNDWEWIDKVRDAYERTHLSGRHIDLDEEGS